MGIRRVVTGHSTDGKAIVASDEVVEPIQLALLPGFEFVRLWGADAPPQFPDDGSMPAHHAYFPPVGGFRFGLFTVPPATDVVIGDLDVGAALAAMVHDPGHGCRDRGRARLDGTDDWQQRHNLSDFPA